MKDSDVAIRYARALFQAAHDKKEVSPLRSTLGTVSHWFKAEPELMRLFFNPAVPFSVKEKAIRAILPPESPTVLGRFLGLLIRNKRLDLLHQILVRFEQLADTAEGVTRAQVRTSRELSEPQRRSIVESLGRALGSRVEGEFDRDESLLGGFVVRLGDKVMDLSISGQLARMKENLIKAS